MSSSNKIEFDHQSGDTDLDEQNSSANHSFESRTRGSNSVHQAEPWSSDHGVNSNFRRETVLDTSEQAGRFRPIPSHWVDRENDQTNRTTAALDFGSQSDLRGPPYQQHWGHGIGDRPMGSIDTRGQMTAGHVSSYHDFSNQFNVNPFQTRTERPLTATAFQPSYAEPLAQHTHRFPGQYMAPITQMNQFINRSELPFRQPLHSHMTDQYSNTPRTQYTGQDDGVEYLRSVVIRTATPIQQPYDIDSYFKKQFRHHQIIDNILMDTFEGVVYVTFKDEKDAHQASRMTHNPESSNILEIWLSRKEDFDFLKDSISVHGDRVSHPEFQQHLVQMITTSTNHAVLQVIQSDCPASMLIRVNNTLSLIDMSRLLIAISMDLDVKVAPVKKCCMISVEWDQRHMAESVVLDYIQWKYNGVQIKAIHPIRSGVIIALENEKDVFKIISEKNQAILGRPLQIQYYHPCLSLEAYQKISHNHGSFLMSSRPLTAGNYNPHGNVNEGAKHISHQGYSMEATQAPRNAMDWSGDGISRFNQLSTFPQSMSSGSGVFTTHGIPWERNSRVVDSNSSNFTAEKGDEFRSSTPFDPSHKILKGHTSTGMNSSLPDERQHAGTSSSQLENSMRSNSNTQKKAQEFEIREDELQLLVKTKFIEKLQVDHDDLTLDYQVDTGKIVIFGDASLSKLAKFEISHHIKNEIVSFDLSWLGDEELQIFKMEGFAEQINEDFDKNSIAAYMSCVNDDPTVLYDKHEDKQKIESTLRRFITLKEYKIDSKKIIVYQSKQWNSYLDKVKAEDGSLKFSTIKLDRSKPCLLLVGSSHLQFIIKKKLKEFEEIHSYKAKNVEYDNNLQEYSETFFSTEMQNIAEETRELGATIQQIDGAFLLEGLKDGIQYAENKLINLRDSIKTKRQTLDYPGCTEFLQRDGESDLLQKIGRKYTCLIKLSEDGAFEESTDDEQEDTLTTVACGHIKHRKITVVKGDPQMLKVNRILNFIKTSSINDTQKPKGFIGGQDSWNKVKKKLIGGYMENHETTGEKNKDLKIHHFVCNNEKKTVSEALKLGFYKASQTKCPSIAIALEGIELSREICSKLIAEAVLKQLNDQPSQSLKDIFICGDDEIFLQTIASDLEINSPQDKARGPRLTRHQAKPQERQKKKIKNKNRGNKLDATSSYRSLPGIDSKSKIVFKPITVELISGDILAATTDAIVTSVQNNLDMSLGQVIRYVLKEGGNEIQEELNIKYPNGIGDGEFAVTGAGRLHFKRIYHACLPTWNASTSVNPIKKLVYDMLEEAGKENLASIAIPALGTAAMSYDPVITCKNILSAIEDFAIKHQQSTVNSVKLVVFTANTDIMKAYGQAVSRYGSSSMPQPQTYSSVGTPAKKYNNSFGNIAVQLITGDITNQKTNAIVVSVDKTLDLRKGRVASAILTIGGQQIQKELNQKFPNGLEHFGYAKTGSGNLACKEIFFVCLPHWQSFDKKKMKKLLLAILNDIDSSQGTTVSLPAFGTGNLGYPPEDTQSLTIGALQTFATNNPHYLRTVEIVVHPADKIVQQAFLKGLNMPLAPATTQASLQMVSTQKKESPGMLKKIGSAVTNALGFTDSNKSTENVFKVGSVTLTVKKGDITEETCDAFLVAVKDDMNLESSGAVGSQIAKKCDSNFIKRCQQKASDLELYGFTSVAIQGGSLKCKELYFINMGQYSNQWDIGIEKILVSAEKKGFTTLALPTLGAALPDTDISKLIQQIKVAIISFAKESPKSLTDIRLVVYDKDILKAASEQSQGSLYSESVILTGEDEVLSENAHVVYYFTEESNVRRAMEDFATHCSLHHKDDTTKNSSIKQFTDAHFKRLERKGYKNMIKVTYSKDEGMINMTGFGDLAKMRDLITDIEKEIQKQMMENLGTDTPVHWQYEMDDIFIDFSNVLNVQLEADFKGKKQDSVIDFDDETYSVDFEKKTITHKDGLTMKIRRRDALEAGEPIPKHWQDMSVDESFKLVELAEDSEEYIKVDEYYRQNGADGDVHKIERVQNRSLYQQYLAKKREIDQRNPGHPNELLLFHGSDFKAVNDINNTGFNRSYCGKNATVFGLGVYFAQSSAYSEQYAKADDKDVRKLYLARVLVGVSVVTDSNTKYLPKQPGKDIPYDSGIAPASRTEGIHIIFHDSQAYPEYIITFSLPDDHVAP